MSGITGFYTGGGAFLPTPDAVKQPEPVSAVAPYTFTTVLGRQIPVVIGTGKVEGVPVIGGSSIVDIPSTSDQSTGGVGGIIGLSTGIGVYLPDGNNTVTSSSTTTSSGATTQQVAVLGYLLAYDPFGAGYNLIRVEINNVVVYDAENGIGASETFRFYGGQQTTVDPITAKVIGANAGAWQNFAMIYLDGYVSSSPPSVKCVISNASANSGGTTPIAWTGTVPNTFADISGWYEAYDPSQDLIYHLLTSDDIASLTTVNLVVLDTQTLTELYRIPLDGSDIYAVPDPITHVIQRPSILAVRGTSYVLIRFSRAGEIGYSRVYDTTTGAIIAEWPEPDTSTTVYWNAGQSYGSKYVFIGSNRFFSGDGHIRFAVVDLAAQTLTVTESSIALGEPAVWGRQINGTTSFFSRIATPDTEVYEHVFNGDAWTSTLVYTDAGTVDGLRFDPLTGYLIVTAGSANVRYVNPDTGAVIATFSSGGKRLISDSVDGFGGYERFWARPGFAFFVYTHGSAEDILLLDISAKTFSTWSGTVPHGTTWKGAIFDQNNGAYYSWFGDNHWTQYALPSVIPGAMTLQNVLTKSMFLAGYGSGELTFDGFTGLSAFGFVINSDTNIRTIVQAVADIYTFAFSDTGDGFYFKKPGRDASFAIDAALTTADLVFGDKSAIDSVDEATIRQTARVELQYISKTDYNSRPASFTLPPLNNSIRTDRYSTSLVLTDADAQTFVTSKYFDLQAKRRTHAFSVLPGTPSELLPGDIVTVPSGDVTYTVQVDSIAMDRTLKADIAATDFLAKVATTITSVSNTGLTQVPINYATQYIHLDIPLFRYADDLGGTGLRQYGVLAGRGQANWPGGVLYSGYTTTMLLSLLTQAPHNGVIGACIDVLGNPVDPFGTADTSTVTIRRTAGDAALLVDKTEAEVLAGANLAFIGRAGRWEGVGYKTVTDNGDGTYTLSGFSVRGYRGSEVWCDAHAAGDTFVMIDPSWLDSAVLPLTDLHLTKYSKALGIGQSITTGSVVPNVIRGIAETPYACRNLVAALGAPDGIDLTWDYRSRLATGLNPANFGEATLSFQIDILATDGVTVLRTLTATTNSKHYAHADVLTDFGSDPPTELFFNVYMMSAVVGRGYKARGHKYFSGIGSPIGLLLSLTKA